MSQNKQQAIVRYGTGIPTNTTYPITVAERKSAITTRGQLKAMEQERIKAHFAQQALEDISTARMEHFTQGAETIWDIKNRPGRSADLQDIIDQAAVSTTLRMDSYQQKSADIAAGQVITIQGAPTYTEPSWKPQ